MKHFLTITLFFLIQITFACNCLDFDDAKKQALIQNKLILAHFSNHFAMDENRNGYLKIKGLEKEEEIVFNKKFIYVCFEPSGYVNNLKAKYYISKPSELLILDGLGNLILKFDGSESNAYVYEVLSSFSAAIPELSTELIEYKKVKTYDVAARIFEKYVSYSSNKNKEVKNKLLVIATQYLTEAKNKIKNSDKSKNIKTQNFELLGLYHWALEKRYDIIKEKIDLISEKQIEEKNKGLYYYLKLLIAKNIEQWTLADIESKFKAATDYEYFAAIRI